MIKGSFIQVVNEKGYYDVESQEEIKEYLEDIKDKTDTYIFNGLEKGYITYDELQTLPDDNYVVLYQEDDGSMTYYQRANINVNKEQIEKILSQKLTKDWDTNEDLTKQCAYIYRMSDGEKIA